jgi:3-hydroxyacyl-CoA dehydrogenase
MVKEIRNVAIVGAGVMGVQIGLRVAAKTHNRVSITDISERALERSKEQQEAVLAEMVNRNLLKVAEKQNIEQRIAFTFDLKQCLAGADLVIESIVEELAAKRKLFQELDALAPPDAILATNSSTIPVSRIEDVTRRQEQILNIHFYMPDRMPMVDLMGGTKTSQETMEAAERWVTSIDSVPIKLKKECLGFCMNRIWHVARIEALKMWAGGYVDFKDIDRAWMIFTGMWAGPFGIMDSIGLDTVYNVHMVYYNEDPRKYGFHKPPDRLKEMIDKCNLGVKTGKGFYDYPDADYLNPDFLKKRSG